MQNYEPIARKYRPNRFSEVIGQGAIVQTLTNALKKKKIAHAYLFCGTRGTGKTTLARILAKALNCLFPDGVEPCNECTCCLEIQRGRSLDVIEIDGASNRGIEDAKTITETSIYAPASSRYKIFIVDEVHMLTKEAFNALLKTLEEPPPAVKFFFATTEPHKLPATILSRCQRFDLCRISAEEITQNLFSITQKIPIEAEKKALDRIATFAEGSLRDAQSMLERILCYEDKITLDLTLKALGCLDLSLLSDLDKAVDNEDLSFLFSFMEKIFLIGKDFSSLIDELLLHFRNHLAKQLGYLNEEFFSPYNKEQLLYLIDLLFGVRQKLSRHNLSKVHLEAVLLKILRSKQRLPIDAVIKKLESYKEIKEQSSQEEPLTSIPFTLSEEKPKEAVENKPAPTEEKSIPPAPQKDSCHLDTLLRFASVELEGTLKRPKD